MALPINIEDLINQKVVESARIEYKADWNPEPIIHSICAFANDIDNWGGGYIVIGVNEKNGMPETPIAGLDTDSIDNINKELLQKCNLIEPRYLPLVETYEYEGEKVLVLWAPGGESRPYKCPVFIYGNNEKKAKSDKAYYIRKLSNTIRANQQEEKDLFQLSETIPFDDRVNMRADIEDMRSGLISEYLHEVGSNLYENALRRPLEDVAQDMKIIGGPKELRKPLNVGLMFFSENPEEYFEYARIEVVDKPDPTGVGMTEKTFSGPLDRQLRDALSYIRNYIIKEKIHKVSGRAEADRIYNYPYDAIEEALSNAVYHKSYQIGEPITVTVTPEKMEITSLPGPDRTISDDDISNCRMISRRYRNRRIGDFLKELRLVEGRNTGIPTILKSMRQNGSDSPIFETDADRTYLTVILPVQKDFLETTALSETEKKKVRRSFKELTEAILQLLEDGRELSTNEIAESLGYSGRSSSLLRAIKQLLDENKISYVQQDSLKSKTQKLHIIDK